MRQTYRFIPDALNDKGSALNDPPCHSEHGEESRPEKDKKEIHRFALNDRRNALNDKGSALNDSSCHSEHSEESRRKKKYNKQIKK